MAATRAVSEDMRRRRAAVAEAKRALAPFGGGKALI